MDEFDITWRCYRSRIERVLEERLSQLNRSPKYLHEAIRYISLNGGKRLRAMLVYASGELFGADLDQLDVPAIAVELIHAFSLAHDDLPAMDDDDLRRGQPSCHRAFDEATAILAGDAAHSLAFEILATDPRLIISSERRLQMINILANATGAEGMAGGQSLDMLAMQQETSLDALNKMHSMKTGALIRASCRLGGLAAGNTTDRQHVALDNFGKNIGLAFQIVDDILDVTSDSATLGKRIGADAALQKSTYVSLLGLEGARQECDKLLTKALESARVLGDNTSLFQQLAHFVVNRSY